MLKKLILVSMFAVSAFAMHSAELNINDKDLEVSAKFDIGQFNENVEPDTMFIGGKFLNPDKSHSDDSVDNIDPYAEVNFLIMKEIGNKGMSFGMGAKLNYSKVENTDYSALPLGIEFAYKIPADDLIPMSLNGSLYYAPEVLSFSKATGYLEYRIHYDIELIENAGITLGYRNINMDFENSSSSFNYNSSWYFGFKIGF